MWVGLNDGSREWADGNAAVHSTNGQARREHFSRVKFNYRFVDKRRDWLVHFDSFQPKKLNK